MLTKDIIDLEDLLPLNGFNTKRKRALERYRLLRVKMTVDTHQKKNEKTSKSSFLVHYPSTLTFGYF